MAINPLGGAGPANIAGAASSPKVGEGFGKVMKAQTAPKPAEAARTEASPTPVKNAPATEAKSVQQASAGKCKVESAARVEGASKSREAAAAKVLDQVSAAQQRMDSILKLAESGKAFSPAELLSLQAHVYRASQELDLAGKVVEKATGGVKQVLQTQV